MRLFKRVAIVGTGLIGGSMALAIKRKGLAEEVIGISRHKKTLWLAKKNHIIDYGSQLLDVVRDADLVILATPVNTILSLAPAISKLIKSDCIVSDVGSTKQEIVSELEVLFPRYVGSHPLAGSEKRGVMHADADIFRESLCILTPTENTEAKAMAKVERLWKEIGAKVVFLRTDRHDKILSFVSHLPHVIAFSLIAAVPRKYLRFSSAGLKDTTRIAASDSQLWTDIFLSNRICMLSAIESFQKNLSRIKTAISRKDKKLLIKILQEARRKRSTFFCSSSLR